MTRIEEKFRKRLSLSLSVQKITTLTQYSVSKSYRVVVTDIRDVHLESTIIDTEKKSLPVLHYLLYVVSE